MVMATYIKPKSKSSRKSKKRRQSAQPIDFKKHQQVSSADSVTSAYPKWGYNSKSHNIAISPRQKLQSSRLASLDSKPISANPHRHSARMNGMHNRPNRRARNGTGNLYGGSTPTEIPSNLAIIYPQDNLLWSYYKNKAKIIEQNQWMPIVSLWRQSKPNIVYMLRGSNKKALSNQSDTTNKRKKKRNRSKSVQHHFRTHTPSAPIPDLSTLEKATKKKVPTLYQSPKLNKYRRSKRSKKGNSSAIHSLRNKSPTYSEYTAQSSKRLKKKKTKTKTKRKASTETDIMPIPKDFDINASKSKKGNKKKTTRKARSKSNATPLIDSNNGYKKKSKSRSKSPKSPTGKASKRSNSNYFGNNIYKQENEEKNPCKFYQITVSQDGIDCKNIFDFPHCNIQQELTWFDEETKSLLLVINDNNKKNIELQIIKHNIFADENQIPTPTPTPTQGIQQQSNPKPNVKVSINKKVTPFGTGNIFGAKSPSPIPLISQSNTALTALDETQGDYFAFGAEFVAGLPGLDMNILNNITTGSRRGRDKKSKSKPKKKSVKFSAVVDDKREHDRHDENKDINVKTNLKEKDTKKRKRSTPNVKAKHDKERQMSASQLFHMKLASESLRIPVTPPRGYSHIFRDCQCLKFWHHKPSNEFLLLLEKYEKKSKSKTSSSSSSSSSKQSSTKNGYGFHINMPNEDKTLGKLLLKIKLNFYTTEIERMSFGIVNEEDNDIIMGQKYDIIAYDYDRSMLIIDTFYEPLSPLSSNPFGNKGGIKKLTFSPSSTSNMYNQYNKWFSFASKPFSKTKKQVITKKFHAIGLNDFVFGWKVIYQTSDLL